MSTILVNTLTGTSTAGSIAVTGEGNSTTTNLQQGLAKAWVNFNGTSTLAISDSFNMASVTDNGTGNYTPVSTNSMGNTNYSFSLAGREQSGGNGGYMGLNDSDNQTASGFQIRCRQGTSEGTGDDRALVTTAYFGDLA